MSVWGKRRVPFGSGSFALGGSYPNKPTAALRKECIVERIDPAGYRGWIQLNLGG